ncbi:MAG: Uma2 family endonuclease [Elainellaceae cyanobacterium]
MVSTDDGVSTKLSLADYLSLEAEYEGRQEFVDGEIITMPPESPHNIVIAMFLMTQFVRSVPFYWMRTNTEIVVASRVRMPDLMILGEELSAVLDQSGRSTVMEEMPAPLLVVEVVSPGKANADRDYRYKRSEYGTRGIPEYWIVDPEQQRVSVLTLVDGWYEVEEFEGETEIRSAQFAALGLTAAKVLSPKEGE